MPENASEPWNGRERRTNPRLRQLLDQMNERILELHRQVVAQSVQMAQMRVELDQLERAQAKNELVVAK